MKIQILQLRLRTRKTIETIPFSPSATFLHGPIGKGKSTVARLIDYCLGGGIERTPAIQREFISAELSLVLGTHVCTFERSATDSQALRVSWENTDGTSESVNASFDAEETPLLEGTDVFNLSDLIFYLCDVSPIGLEKGLGIQIPRWFALAFAISCGTATSIKLISTRPSFVWKIPSAEERAKMRCAFSQACIPSG